MVCAFCSYFGVARVMEPSKFVYKCTCESFVYLLDIIFVFVIISAYSCVFGCVFDLMHQSRSVHILATPIGTDFVL